MKKWFALAMCAALAVSVTTSALATADGAVPSLISSGPATGSESGYAIYVDGKDTGVDACIMVPLRTFAKELGFAVTWNGDGTVGMDNGVMHTTVTIGEDLYQVVTSVEGRVGMSAPFSLGTAPYVVDSTTYVPLELFEVLLGNRENTIALENGVISISTAKDAESSAQIPNPFTNCDTLAEAEKLAGFPLCVPNVIDNSDSRQFRTIDGDMLEVVYLNGECETACVRKAPGTENISGDYTDYENVDAVSVNGAQVTMKGNEDQVSLAIWTNGGYTYSITLEHPVSSVEMTDLVSNIQ
ncbi:MAG: stalk domain-containing protein [Lawsonibacter sp.]